MKKDSREQPFFIENDIDMREDAKLSGIKLKKSTFPLLIFRFFRFKFFLLKNEVKKLILPSLVLTWFLRFFSKIFVFLFFLFNSTFLLSISISLDKREVMINDLNHFYKVNGLKSDFIYVMYILFKT